MGGSEEFEQIDDPEQIISALGESLDGVYFAEEQLRQADFDPFEHAEFLAKGLAQFDDALELYRAADRDSWKEDAAQAVDDEFARVSAIAANVIEAQEALPEILTDRKVIIEDDGILLQSAPAAKQETTCCFTSIRFRNNTQFPIEIRVTGEDGTTESDRFSKGQRKTVRKVDGRNRKIPGGLGRCVTIEARARYREGWGEWHSTRICCDDENLPREGADLPLTRPVNERHSTRFAGVQLVAIKSLSPCPEMRAGGGAGSTGTASSGITSIPGLEVDDHKHHFGAHTVLRFVPNGCRRFCFVQGVKRVTKVKYPGTQDFKVMTGLSTAGTNEPGDRWILDIRDKDRTPCYPHTSPLLGGGLEMRDFPGVENPYGRFKLDGQLVRFPPRTVLQISWTFKTWIVCLDPAPVSLLGKFDWGLELTLNVGRSRRDTNGKVTMTPPQFSDQVDVDEYKRVAGQARDSAGFLPR